MKALVAFWNRLDPRARDLIRRGLHSGWQTFIPLALPIGQVILARGSAAGVSIPWAGIGISVAVAVGVSWVGSFIALPFAHVPVWLDGLLRGVKTAGAAYVGALTASGVDLLHFRWGAMLTSGLVAGALAVARFAITLGWFGGPETAAVVAENLRTGKYLQAAAVGDGTTVTAAGFHQVTGEHAAGNEAGATFEPEEVDPDDPRLAASAAAD